MSAGLDPQAESDRARSAGARRRAVSVAAFALLALVVGLQMVFAPRDDDPISTSPRGETRPIGESVAMVEHEARDDRVALPTVADPVAAPTNARAVTGKVRVRGADGRLQLARAGSLGFEVWRDGNRQSRPRIETVRDGAWSAAVAAGTKLVASTYTSSAGRFGRAERLEITSADEGAVCDVVVDWEKGITLRCLDAATSRELADVEVRLIAASAENLGFHPPGASPHDPERDQRTIVGDSPLHLPCFALPMRGWARAPGTTWRSFTFSGCSGERVLHIEGGGALEVVVADAHAAPRPAWISVWDCAGSRAERVGHAQLGADGLVRFEALPARELVVCLTGAREQCALVLDVATISVVAGSTVTAELCAECPAARARTGTITLDLVGPTASIRSIATEVADARRPQLAAGRPARSDDANEPYPRVLELGRFAPGRHRIDVGPAVASVEVDVARGGEHRIAVRTRANRTLAVVVVDRESDRVLEHASVNARLCAGQTKGPWVVAAFDKEAQVHEVEVGAGDVALAVFLDGYESTGLTVADADVAAGVRVELGRGSRYPVRILMEDAGSGVGFSIDAWSSARVTPIPPCTGRVLRVTYGTAGEGIDARSYVEWTVDRAGRYELTLPEFDGYAPLAPREIDVTSTDAAPITVQLTPARR